MRSFTTKLTLAFLTLALWATGSNAQIDSLSFPRLANFYYDDFLSALEATKLAEWDLVVLGPQNPAFSPSEFRLIKTLNQRIVLLCYVNSVARAKINNYNPNDPQYPYREGMRDEWRLRKLGGKPAGGHWPGVEIMNPTDFCPIINGFRWNTYVVNFTVNILQKKQGFDGPFYDDALKTIDWLKKDSVDINNDGKFDNAGYINAMWQTGLQKEFDMARDSLGAESIIVTNSAFWPRTNGRLFENVFYDAEGWVALKDSIQSAVRRSRKPSYVMVNANTRNKGDWQNWRQFRFALCSTLMTDALFSYDYGDTWHAQLWWYDEYDSGLGMALADAIQVKLGVWRRDYQHGTVLVNITSVVQAVDLGTDYKHLVGTQDMVVNNGRVTRQVILPALDGVVLKTTSTTSVGSQRITVPSEFRLEQNYPNPFNPETTIKFALPKASTANFKIYNQLGKVVVEHQLGTLPAGEHTITWDGKDQRGNLVSTGVYYDVFLYSSWLAVFIAFKCNRSGARFFSKNIIANNFFHHSPLSSK